MDEPFLTLSQGTGRHRVTARAVLCGGDLMVSFTGGDAPHIGACAAAVPRPSLKGDGSVSATASVFCVPGHKDDLLARQAALDLASACRRVVCVCVGLHIDGASAGDITLLRENFLLLLERLAEACREALPADGS